MTKLLSIQSAAEQLGVCPDTIRRLIKRGQLRAVRVLRRVMIPTQQVERLCDPDHRQPESVSRKRH